jgi:hypothetical protein
MQRFGSSQRRQVDGNIVGNLRLEGFTIAHDIAPVALRVVARKAQRGYPENTSFNPQAFL